MRKLFTSESVSEGHPDKVCDQISDAVLDAHLELDPDAHVACETLVTTNYCVLAGEVKGHGKVDYESVVRETIKDIGYTLPEIGFHHETAEFVNRFMTDRPPLAAVALTTDTSNITSISNDFSFDDIFSKQIQALGKQGDLALGISTSGNSPNVVIAIETAKEMGLHTAALTGGNGGVLAEKADVTLNVPTVVTPHIQETHLWVEHLLCWMVDDILFPGQA